MNTVWARLVGEAADARQRAYAPYSGFAVGAALLAADGSVFTGANVENASYGLTLCAERVALAGAVAAGKREFAALAVVAEGSTVPCGACLQSLAEFAPSLPVILAEPGGPPRALELAHLLPKPFTSREKLP
ncbi:MAG: cytidine deaminase [bacterium]|nr:cytidine deaminase [bacterium]